MWIRTVSAAAPSGALVLPDNCSDVILRLDPESGALADAFVVGIMSRPVTIDPVDEGLLVGVRFKPGAGSRILGVDASSLRDQRVDLAAVDSRLARALAQAVRGTTGRELALGIQQALTPHLSDDPGPPPRVREALDLLQRTRGTESVARLCRDLGVTRQYLARLFDREVGLTPKLVARVMRVRHAMRLATANRRASWAMIALDAGYTDQSHLIADFRALAGVTPAAWLAAREVPDFLSGERVEA